MIKLEIAIDLVNYADKTAINYGFNYFLKVDTDNSLPSNDKILAELKLAKELKSAILAKITEKKIKQENNG